MTTSCRPRHGVIGLLLALASSVHAAADPLVARMVRDINMTPAAGLAGPTGFAAGIGRVYFAATTPETGRELFSVDDASNVRLEVDLVAGTGSANPRRGLIFTGTRTVYFVADTAGGGMGLYALDSVTRAVTSITSSPSWAGSDLDVASVVGDRLLFVSWSDHKLWTSDGTVPGTLPLDAALGAQRTVLAASLAVDQGRLLFLADGPDGTELWSSDGRPEGTHLVRPLDPALHAEAACAIAHDGGYWAFVVHSGMRSLWRYSFAGAELSRLSEIAGGALNCRVAGMGSDIYFVLTPAGFPHPETLWRSTPTPGGVSLIATLSSDPAANAVEGIAAYGANLVFRSDVLWRSDGTTAGTRVVTTPEGTVRPYSTFRRVAGGLLFSAVTDAPASPGHMWVTDGSDLGTRRVAASDGLLLDDAAILQGRAYAIHSSGSDPSNASDIWSSDGTASGTREVARLWDTTGDAMPADASTSASRSNGDGSYLLFWNVSDWTVPLNPPNRLWMSDGSVNGTRGLSTTVYGGRIEAAAPGVDGGAIFASYEDAMIYVADASLEHVTPVAGSDAYFFQGFESAAGRNAIFSCAMGSGLCGLDATLSHGMVLSQELHGAFAAVGDVHGAAVFFADATGLSGWELWRSDGTTAGTFRLVPTLNPQTKVAIERDGEVYFPACDASDACSIYVSDATRAGTHALTPFGDPGANLLSMAFFGDRLLFVTVKDGIYSLWCYDGSAGSAPALLLTRGGAADPVQRFSLLSPSRSGVRFAVSPAGAGMVGMVYTSDGTAAGTQHIATASAWQPTAELFAAYDDDRTVYTCWAADTGTELCETDGSDAGTRLVRDIFPGPNWSRITLMSARHRVYFTADDAHHGLELWTVDGERLFVDGFDP